MPAKPRGPKKWCLLHREVLEKVLGEFSRPISGLWPLVNFRDIKQGAEDPAHYCPSLWFSTRILGPVLVVRFTDLRVIWLG